MAPTTDGQQISNWRIRDFAPGDGIAANATVGAGTDWLPITAPGDTYVALIAAGRLDDPYAARNEDKAAWVRHREWWWHTRITLPQPSDGEIIELVFDGLDTFADIYLDGAILGRADNMFRSWRFDVTALPPGEHNLALCFHPSIDMVAGDPVPLFSTFTDRVTASRRTLMRKAQFGWGWDWGPDLPTVGIWGPVRLTRRRAMAVRSVNFSTLAIEADHARVEVYVDAQGDGELSVELIDPVGARVASGVRNGTGALSLEVANPQLWWTADLGTQPLYTLLVRTADAPQYRRQVGIRTIAIDQSPDPHEPGTTFFRFVLNGVPIFAKGANWIPASSFVGAIADDTYRDLLVRAVQANMNMIRVWGGGIYEHDIFYDECDRLGLLVWQDFMFACAPYPEKEAFLDNIRAEAAEQVNRLRHHACLALWCGNNENQAIQFFVDHASGQTNPLEGLVIYDEVLPKLLTTLDPHTEYWPSSPWGGPSPNSMRGGDVHNWTVWHGTPLVLDTDAVGDFESAPEGVAYTRYAEDMGRFVSEFGLQGAPDIGTLRRWMAPEDLELGSAGFLERIKDKADKATAMMLPVTGAPHTLEQFVEFTMLAQAEGLKFGIEHYRRRKPHCSGALIWQHNDCWPCVSWSLIDYDGVAKSSWYATGRAFSPVLASFRREGNDVELWITNDTLAPVGDVAQIGLTRFEGGQVWHDSMAFDVPANASVCIWRGSAEHANDRLLTVRSLGKIFPANRLLLAAVKDLVLDAEPTLRAQRSSEDGNLLLTVTADSYALAVHLRSDDPAIRYDANHFDLAAGESCVVGVTRRDGGPVAADAIEVRCFNMTMGAATRARRLRSCATP